MPTGKPWEKYSGDYAASLGACKNGPAGRSEILAHRFLRGAGDYKVVETAEEAGASVVIEEFSVRGPRLLGNRRAPTVICSPPGRSIFYLKRSPGFFQGGLRKKGFAFLGSDRRLPCGRSRPGIRSLPGDVGIEAYLFSKEADKMNLPMLTGGLGL